MDLFIDPPATTAPPPAPLAVVAEPPIYIAHAANPTPSFASINHNHPPYAEMITAAITALKERNGSSRQAIAKYIEKNYSSLPSNHSAMLTHHLKRLKNNGHLLMVKHSYKLPRSVPTLTDGHGCGDGGGNGNGNGNGPSSAPKRGRGRPPKPKVVGQLQLQTHNNVVVGPDSVLVSLGLADPVAIKKGPGRPPKAKKKRGPGRPPRPKSFPLSVDGSALVVSELGGPGVVKRGRGRPPKTKMMMGQSGPKMRSVGPRPRGRPKRDVPMGKTLGRPRGRRLKNVVIGGDGGGVVGGVLPAKQQGRPPRVGGIKKPRKLTGRPLGRPRKNASIPGIASQQLVAYEDLKGKLEFFKSRIRQAVITVKPHLNPETALSGFAALQELEELATMDLNAPLNVQVHIQVQDPLVQH